MHTLHAIWDTDNVHIWAESSSLPLNLPPRRGRKPDKPKPQKHPFTLPADDLENLIKDVFGKISYTNDMVTLLLSSTRKGPFPSPQLILDDYNPEEIRDLLPWNIETLALDPYQAFNLLLDLPISLPTGIASGSSLGFWQEVASFTLELITKESFVPRIKEDKAVWMGVITDRDSERLILLNCAMPPISRALISSEGGEPYPRTLLMSFIDKTLDAFIRESLSSISLLPPRHGRRPKITPLMHRFAPASGLNRPRMIKSGC